MAKTRLNGLSVLRRIYSAIGSRFELMPVLNTCVEALGDAMSASRCFIHMKDEAGVFVVSHEFTQNEVVPMGVGNTMLTAASYQAHIKLKTVSSGDVLTDDQFVEQLDQQVYAEMDVRGILAVPILMEGAELGQLVVHYCGKPHRFSDEEVDLAETVACQIAVLLQTLKLLAEQEKLSGSLATMNQDLSRLYVELAAKDEQIDRFMHLVSHDLRAPVVAIQGLVDLLKQQYVDQPPDSKPRRYLEIIHKSTEQITGLTSALLEYARLGQTSLRLEEVSIADLVRDTWQRLSLGHDNVALEIFTPLPMVRADRAKLTQILQNLFENAIKYRKPEGKAVVDITCQEMDDCWQFAVNDDGIGFPPAEAERMFDIFERLAHSNTRPGTGIGLASVLEIARLHGGTAWAAGRPGKGSTFYFTIAKRIPDRPPITSV